MLYIFELFLDTNNRNCLFHFRDYCPLSQMIIAKSENKNIPIHTDKFTYFLRQVCILQLFQVREERKAEEKRKKKMGTPVTPFRRGRADDLRRQTLMNVSNNSASSRAQRSASVSSNKGSSVLYYFFLLYTSLFFFLPILIL